MKRIQRKRTKGWRMPPNTVYVGRGSKWGNPFVVDRDGDVKECLRLYSAVMMPYTHQPPHNDLASFMISQANLEAMKLELKGKNLACWCKEDEPCHGDLLLRWAND
jgi:hypothetical protein